MREPRLLYTFSKLTLLSGAVHFIQGIFYAFANQFRVSSIEQIVQIRGAMRICIPGTEAGAQTFITVVFFR